MAGTRGFHKKSLVEQAGEAHTGTSEGTQILARLGQTNRVATSTASKSARNKLFVHFKHTIAHTHAHTHAVTKGDQASFSAGKAFCKVSALVPTLGFLLVFSISCRGIKGPGGQQLLFIIGKASVARMSVKNDKNARNPRGTRGFRPFSSFCPKSYLVFCFGPMPVMGMGSDSGHHIQPQQVCSACRAQRVAGLRFCVIAVPSTSELQEKRSKTFFHSHLKASFY